MGRGRAQDPRLSDFGDRRFRDESGEVFINIPRRAEVIADMESAGWIPKFDAMRSELAAESAAVVAFSDNCRPWVFQVPRRGSGPGGATWPPGSVKWMGTLAWVCPEARLPLPACLGVFGRGRPEALLHFWLLGRGSSRPRGRRWRPGSLQLGAVAAS